GEARFPLLSSSVFCQDHNLWIFPDTRQRAIERISHRTIRRHQKIKLPFRPQIVSPRRRKETLGEGIKALPKYLPNEKPKLEDSAPDYSHRCFGQSGAFNPPFLQAASHAFLGILSFAASRRLCG